MDVEEEAAVDERNSRFELLSGIVLILVTAFVATFIVSLINTVCR